MKYRAVSLVVALLMVLGLVGSLAGVPTITSATTLQATTTTVASGLDSPRGMTFGPDNALYVTEAGIGGSGPCITANTGEEVCYGPTGAVTRVDVDDSTQQRVLTGLPSLVGVQSGDATGPHDIARFPDGSSYLVTGLGAPPERRSGLGDASSDFARLTQVVTDSQVLNIADLAAYEQANNPDDSIVDTNPYALTSLPEWHVVADAGANTLLEIDHAGDIFRATAFPTRTVTAPPPPVDPPPRPMEPVPDAVTVGPDGAYYVGELTGFPFPVGGARVYRVVPGQTPDIYVEGFTNIIDLTFDKDGNLYVLEIAANSLLQGRGPSALSQVAPDMTRTPIITGSGALTAATSLAISPQGGIYVANSGVISGTGEILRVDLCDEGDMQCQEPVALPPALTATLSGTAEVDDTGTPGQGDPDGSGRAIITLNADAGRVCVQATVSDIAQPTAAHIHEGAAGVNGPPIVGFTDLINGPLISGCVDAESDTIETIRSYPSRYHLNVHNDEFPAGAVRGQLVSRGERAQDTGVLTLWHAWQGEEKTFLEQLATEYQGAEIEVTSFATDDELLEALRTSAQSGDTPNLYLGPGDWSDELREIGIADAYCRPNQCPQCEGPNPPPWCEYATGNFGGSLNTDFNVVSICRPGGGCEVCLGPDAPRWCERVQFEQGPELDIFQADFVDIFDDGVFPVGIPVRWVHNAVAHRPGWFVENQQQVPGSLDEALQLETDNPGAVYLDNDSVLDGDPIPFPALQDFIDAVAGDPSPQPSDAGILATGETAIQRLQAEAGPLFQPSLADYQPQPIVGGVYINPATEQISQALDFAYLIADEETQVELYEQTGRLPTHGEAWQMISENEDEPQPGEIAQNLVTFGQQSMLAFTGKQPDLTIPDDLVDIPPPPFGSDACGRAAWEWYQQAIAGQNLSRPERSLYYTSALDMAARCRMYQPIEEDGFCAERASTVFASMFFDNHAMATGVQESQDAALARYNLCRLRWVFDQFGPEVGAGNLEHIIGGLTIQLTIPSQTFTDTTDVVIQDGADTEVMTDADTLVGSVFAINAYNAESQQPVTELTQSISITVEYDEDLPGDLDETRLALFRWDTGAGQWNEVPGSQWNPAQNTVSAPLEHLSTFAVREATGVQQDNRIYLPLVIR